jgi:hypothetical protein
MNKKEFLSNFPHDTNDMMMNLVDVEWNEGVSQLTFESVEMGCDGYVKFHVHTLVTTGEFEYSISSVFDKRIECLPMKVYDVMLDDDQGLFIMLEDGYALWLSLLPEDMPTNFEYFAYRNDKGEEFSY